MRNSTLTISSYSTSIDAVLPAHRKWKVVAYVLGDLMIGALAWWLFFTFRKMYVENYEVIYDQNFYRGLIILPFYWCFLFYLYGSYYDIYRRHRTKELGQTIFISLLGSIFLFFFLVLDDVVYSYKDYYYSFFALFASHLIPSLLYRMTLTSITVKRLHDRKIGFNTLIIGGGEGAIEMLDEIESLKQSPGFRFKGFVSVNGADKNLSARLPYFGKTRELQRVIEDENIEEVIIAIESSDHKELEQIMNYLQGAHVRIKLIPDNYDIVSGKVKMTNILGAPLIEINREVMPLWQKAVKRVLDISLSVFAILLMLPMYIAMAIAIRVDSKGPIFFTQARIGLHGRPFRIIKFRSMVKHAEKGGPQLSSTHDCRITKVGKFLRKTRLDETPQFWNVLIGEMSLVGPRPERQFYIDQIVEIAPSYRLLHRVKPGITSWGQVKFGYAENVKEMVTRMKYDLLYIENMTLAIDFKILLYTVRTILKGSGK